MSMSRTDLIEHLCQAQHEAYEEAALRNGWDTQHRSRVPWRAVPPSNRATMRASMTCVLDELVKLGGVLPD